MGYSEIAMWQAYFNIKDVRAKMAQDKAKAEAKVKQARSKRGR